MAGLDTSVPLRLQVGDPAALNKSAQRRLAQAHADGREIVVLGTVLTGTWHGLVRHKQGGMPPLPPR